MWLVNWLSSRASAVLNWFGGSYWTFRNRIKNFFTWLNSYAVKAKNWAVDELLPAIWRYYTKATGYAYSKYQAAVAWTNSVRTTLTNWVNSKVQAVRDLLNYQVSRLSSEDQRLSNKLKVGDDRVETGLIAWVKSQFVKILRPFSWVLVYKDLLEDLKDLFSEVNLGKLVTVLNTLFPAILAFATHPLRTIISIIKPAFLDLLSYSIAYALGTEKAELPGWPDWINTGGQGGEGSLPAGVKRELSSPLSSLRISGYTFNEPIGHKAVDLALSRGQAVFAMHSGIVEYVGRSLIGYGHQVTIRGGFWWSRYAHFQEVFVSKGQTISKGQKIGLGDSTGNSSGDHLHLELKYKNSFINPANVLF